MAAFCSGPTCNRQDPSLKNVVEGTPVSALFFSSLNKNILHEGIRYSVFRATGKIISRQSDNELTIIMRSVYMEFAMNDPSASTIGQVRCLNKRVLDFAVPAVVAEINMHAYYLKDTSTQPIPMAHPIHSTQAGSRVLIRDTLF